MNLRPRFSLRTLLLLILTIAGGIGLFKRWDPWVKDPQLSIKFPHKVWSAAFSPDGQNVLVALRRDTGEYEIDVWRLEDKVRLRHYEIGSSAEFTRVQYSPTGRWIYAHLIAMGEGSGTEDLIWDAVTGDRLCVNGTVQYLSRLPNDRPFPGQGELITLRCLQFSPDDRYIAYEKVQNHITPEYPAENTLHVMDTSTKREVAAIDCGEISAAQFSVDGTRLALITKNKKLSIWNSRTARIEFEWPIPFEAENLAFSGDSSRVAISDSETKTAVIDVQTGRTEGEFAGTLFRDSSPLPASVRSPFSPDGTRIITRTWPKKVVANVWQVTPKQAVTSFTCETYYDRADFSVDGSRVFAGSQGWTVAFDAQTGIQASGDWSELPYIEPSGFSPDGMRWLYTGIGNQHLTILDTPPPRTMVGHRLAPRILDRRRLRNRGNLEHCPRPEELETPRRHSGY